MAINDLELILTIKHKWEVLAEMSEKKNDDIFDFMSERNYWLAHAFDLMSAKVVAKALKVYDESKWEK